MLISIVLTLVSAKELTLPAFVGRANYAELLARLQAFDAPLAAVIHSGEGPKPLTCSSLLAVRAEREAVHLRAGQQVTVRFTGLTAAVSSALAACLLDDPPATWTLADQLFQVVSATCDPAQHGWTGRSSYEGLAAAQLLQSDAPARQVTLEFASPTAFKSKEMTVPVPLPGLVFGSLVERWNAFSPIVLTPEMRRYGEEVMAISRYKLESRSVGQKGDGLRIGGVGQVTYRALAGDRYWLGVMHMLAEFALYSGVGVQTATGMGQVRGRKGGLGD